MIRLIMNALILALGVFLIYRLHSFLTSKTYSSYRLFKNISEKTQADKNAIESRERTRKWLKKIEIYTNSVKFLGTTKKRDERLEYIVTRIEPKINDVHLDVKSLGALINLLSLVYIGIILVISVFNLKLLVLLVFFKPIQEVVFHILEMPIEDYDAEIDAEFYFFHGRIYNIYKHKQNQKIPIDKVMMMYYNSASPEMKKLIKNFSADYKLTPDKALDKLKAHYRIDKVYRLANELILLQNGRTLRRETLEGFQRELKREYQLKNRRELELKKEKSENIMNIPAMVLMEVIVVWLVSVITSNR